MRTKYIGFVKTSFSSPSLPFRIGGYAPGKNSQFPSFTHPPRTSTLRSRHIRKRSKAAFRKSLHAHKAKRFFSSLPGLVPCPIPVFESAKERRTRLCEKSDRKQGKKRSTSPIFSLFLPVFFRQQRHSSIGFSRRRHQIPMTTAQTRSQEKLHPSDIPTQNKRRHDQSMPVLRTADRQTYVCPPPLSVSFAHKKTATHLPMDSYLKECGR